MVYTTLAKPLIKPRILIVEDQKNVAQSLKFLLEESGFQASVAHTSDEGITQLRLNEPDIILLNLQLADCQAIDLCRKAHALVPSCLVALLSSPCDETKQAIGYAAGADAIIAKPVGDLVLAERLRSLLRLRERFVSHGLPVLYSRFFKVNYREQKIYFRTDESGFLPLNFKSFNMYILFEFFLKNQDLVISREALYDVWQQELREQASLRSIDTVVCRLRRLLHEQLDKAGFWLDRSTFIFTVINFGYRFQEPEKLRLLRSNAKAMTL